MLERWLQIIFQLQLRLIFLRFVPCGVFIGVGKGKEEEEEGKKEKGGSCASNTFSVFLFSKLSLHFFVSFDG